MLHFFFPIMFLFRKNTFDILSVSRHWSSGRFTIQTFMDIISDGILCRKFTTWGTLYNEWWDRLWCICATGASVPMLKGWFLSHQFIFMGAFLNFVVLCWLCGWILRFSVLHVFNQHATYPLVVLAMHFAACFVKVSYRCLPLLICHLMAVWWIIVVQHILWKGFSRCFQRPSCSPVVLGVNCAACSLKVPCKYFPTQMTAVGWTTLVGSS